MAVVPGTQLAGYRIERLLGRGAMGEVYLAEHEGLGRPAAVKILPADLAADPAFRDRFLAESRIAASLDHPHIVPIYEAGDADGRLFIAMRFVEGDDLGSVIARESSLEPKRALALLGGIADALDAAHDRGLVHRDVKPGNILVTRSNRGTEHAYLADFGLVKTAAGRTGSGAIVGSVGYMAPEQIEGRPVDGRADVYSLACVLFEVLTGRAPFVAETDVALLWAHVAGARPRISELRPEFAPLDGVLVRGLAIEIDERYASAGELISAASTAMRGAPAASGTTNQADPSSMPPPAAPAAPAAPTAPPAQAPPTAPLPSFLSRFIGRSVEQAALHALIPEHRLVTVTGTGGVGKTRLAVEVAEAVGPTFADGVGFVDLSAVRDVTLVPTAIAEALAIEHAPGKVIDELVVEALAARRQLLVLDNLEQVAGAAAFLAMLLRRAPRLHLVATSRVPLWVRGEHEYPLEPLPLPAPSDEGDALAENDAVRLFMDEAARHGPTTLTAESTATVAEICRRLDGLPLAIELVAARARSIPLSTLVQRLEHRIDVPAPQVDLPDRQRTLRAAIGWSVDLLSPLAVRLFRRLGVFVGGFPFDAAEALALDADAANFAAAEGAAADGAAASAKPPGSRPDPDIADRLDELVRHSLVRLAPGGSGRYLMLETIRELALDQLAEAGDLDSTRDTELAWLTSVLERSETSFARAEDQAAAIDASDAERANVRDALAWASANGREEAALRLSGARHFWAMRGSAVEGRGWLEDLLGRPVAYGERTLAQARTVLGSLVLWMGDREASREHWEAALGLWQRLGERRKQAVVENNLGVVAERLDDFERSRGHAERALAIMRELDDAPGIGATLGNLGVLAYRLEDFDAAERWNLEALAHGRRIGDLETTSIALTNLGASAVHRGRIEEGRRWMAETLELCRQLDDLEGTIIALETFGQIALKTENPALHVRLFAGAQRLRDEYQAARPPSEVSGVEEMLAQAREQLGDERYEAARQEGTAMRLDELVAIARAMGSAADPLPPTPSG